VADAAVTSMELLHVRLPGLAEELYQAEYLEMMIDYEQFFRWSELRHWVTTEGSLQAIQGGHAARTLPTRPG
jgi:hypothetical protein